MAKSRKTPLKSPRKRRQRGDSERVEAQPEARNPLKALLVSAPLDGIVLERPRYLGREVEL